MEKRKVSVFFVLTILIVFSSLVLAQTSNSTTDSGKVSEAYQCLRDKVSGNCEDLSLQEKTFSLLSIGQCQTSLLDDSQNNGECWPSGDCSIKETSQALMALKNSNGQTASGKSWLLSQNETSNEIAWYLEIESDAGSCEITYSGSTYTVSVGEDRTLGNNAGSCLSLAQNDHWLRISPSCFDKSFQVSCNQDFLTTTVFQETGGTTVHVTSESNSAAAGGSTQEKVDSYCFKNPGDSNCDYEGSLWATLVLDSLGEDISNYLPYLIVKAEDNSRLLPEAFLYMLTGNQDYRDSLLEKQKSNKYWQESGDEHFDTALALYPFQSETPQEKENSKNWLLDTQDEDGCWGNVRNTGFLLASIWPQSLGGGGSGSRPACEDAGYYCTSSASCGGEILNSYSCSSQLFYCCDTPQETQTCDELGGEICSSSQYCSGGQEASAGDISGTEICCAGGGTCETPQNTGNECETQNGVCRFSCDLGEKESNLDCSTSGAICCTPETTPPKKGSLWWVWTLLVLIVLVVVGIIFRDKLRELWLKLKSKFGKSRGGNQSGSHGGGRPGPRPGRPHGFPRGPSRQVPIHPPERRILLPSQPSRPGPKPKKKSSKELDDVLKKLKEMSE